MTITLALRHKANPKWSRWAKFQANFVKFWTFGKYFHSEIIIGNKWVSAHTKDGVQILDLNELNHEYWDYEEVRVDKKYLASVWHFIAKQEDKPYDWRGIYFSQGLKVGIHDKDKWFCSEIVTAIFQRFKIDKVRDLKPHKISPNDLGRIFT